MDRDILRIFCRIIRKTVIAISFLLLCFPVSNSFSETEEEISFSVERIGQMIGNRENLFSVKAPEDGEFSVRIYDDVCTYRVIHENIREGISEVRWDGCGYNGEQLETKYFNFEFHLYGISGQSYSFFFRSPIVENAQHLQFVLPSAGTAYLTEPANWFVEMKAVRDGNVIFEIYTDGEETYKEPACSFEKTIHTGRVEHYTLEKIAGRSIPEEGKYTVRIYEKSRPDEVYSFPLIIRSEGPEIIPVTITGDIMPARNAEDNEIWQAMIRPTVVVDIGPLEHQTVYSNPDRKAESLGTIHGQTQGVSVADIQDDWVKIGAWNHEDASYIEGWIPLKCLKVVEPNQEYGLLVDKKSQEMSIFHNGKRIETLLVSTGRMDEGKYDRETSAGCFLTGLHRVDFSTQGLKYDFVIQYDGGNLLHQIPYSSDGRRDFTQGKAYLGTKASHACIRIQDTPGILNGINAYWIWTHIPYQTKVIILDDPEERNIEKARLSGGTPVEKEYSIFTDSENQSENIVLTFAGDVIPSYSENSGGFDAFFREYGPGYPLEGLKGLFECDDLTSLSLACVLKDNSFGEDPYRTIKWRGLPEYAKLFSASSVELISIGDEHLYDYRQDGYDTTTGIISNVSLWTGNGHSLIIDIKGCLFGFATFSQQDYLDNTDIIKEEIRALREAGCIYVIAQCHWGKESDFKHDKTQEAMARTCVREGADLVVGRHPDNVQGISEINRTPVIYSLGRLITDSSLRRKTNYSLAIQAFFDPENYNKPKIRLIPLISSSSGMIKENNYRPSSAQSEDAEQVLALIQADSGFSISTEND